jgi:hypothetical protein
VRGRGGIGLRAALAAYPNTPLAAESRRFGLDVDFGASQTVATRISWAGMHAMWLRGSFESWLGGTKGSGIQRKVNMEPIEDRSDLRTRLFAANPSEVFAAMSDPIRVAKWWGPTGFTNTIHQFDFRADGKWLLTMHGPDGKNYPNENRFTRVIVNRVFEIEHLYEPRFILTIELQSKDSGTELKWQQTFDTVKQYMALAQFVAEANEQNLDRLAIEVQSKRSAA